MTYDSSEFLLAPRMSAERTVPLDAAWRQAHALLEQHGWRAQMTPLTSDEEFGAWQCRLTDRHSTLIPGGLGAGKGRTDEACVGAVFEAIEHHLSQDLRCYAPQLRRAGDVAECLVSDVIGSLLYEQPGTFLACVQYQALPDGATISLPLGLSVPSYVEDEAVRFRLGDCFDYQGLARYCSNSGSAIGVHLSEATLHALNEVIERDALSLLLCRAFLETGYRPTLLDPDTLPPDLAELLGHVRRRLGEVYLLEITTDVDVPTVCAYTPPTRHNGDHHRRGLGTSLSLHHAVHRALSELLQCELLGDSIPPEHFHTLGEYDPRLLDCVRFDLTAHLRQATCRAYISPPALPSVDHQLSAVIRAVRAAGFTPYRTLLHTPTLPVVHLMVPGMERIMTLLQGHLCLPGPRGLSAIGLAPTSSPT